MINLDSFATRTQQHFQRYPSRLLDNRALNHGFFSLPVDQLTIVSGSVAARHCQDIDGLQQIGLALGVFPNKDIDAWGKLNLTVLIISKIPQLDFRKIH